ncbi:MAG: hypothetical protein HY582_03085 [Candidatus Omnitrophica bacterium]|nr:hypothetical protein [Candidatus Omnitrophota bacterium]
MPLRFFLCAWITWFGWCEISYGFDNSNWEEKKGNHFVVYAQDHSSFTDDVLREAEDVYQDIIRYFGSLPKDHFWSWENRCKIYIYPSQSEYVRLTKQPEWSSGFADVRKRTIVSFENAPDFLESVLPHEMAHLIFREFIASDNRQVPRWLDEGFAISQEKNIRVALDQTIQRAVQTNSALSFQDLTTMSSLHTRPTDQARLFYAQAQSITRFLLERRDPSYFINFCRLLRDGASLEEALRKSYRDFSSLRELEQEWKRHVSHL